MTADLAQVAIDFCREAMGWERPELGLGDCRINAIDGRQMVSFAYHHLNAVMKAVEGFCSRNDLFVSSCRSPGFATWQATIFRHGLETSLGVDYPTLGHALLAACLEAARKLKAA